MKKFFIALLAVLTVSGAMAQQQPAFPDIPAGHWAADAVNRIADLGIVIGFPDGTFRGNEGFTRYQAALVVDRLLRVIGDDIAAALALAQGDIAALAAAVQELGGRLDAVEGELAGVRGDIVALETATGARLADIEAALAQLLTMEPDVGMPADLLAAIQDLQNRLASMEVAVDTALARAEAAEEAARTAAIDPALAAQIAANARGISDLNRIVRLLADDIDRLTGEVRALQAGLPAGIDPALLEQVAANTRDIANIREFVILLRRDQVALRDRVAALEASDAAQDARLDDLEARLAIVEEQLLTFTGSVTLQYVQGTLGGDRIAFDVDRIFVGGAGMRRTAPLSVFTTGADGDIPARERADIFHTPGAFTTTFNVNFQFAGLAGVPALAAAGLDPIDTVLELGLRRATNLMDGDTTFTGYVFEFRNIASTINLGDAAIRFQFGQNPRATFTPYVFQTMGPGFVATIGAPEFLAFLNPTLTVAYGTATIQRDDVRLFGPETYYFGVRGTLSPFQGLVGGVSYSTLDRTDQFTSTTVVYGVDANLSLGFLSVAGEFARSEGRVITSNAAGTEVTGDVGSDGPTDLFYVTATLDGADLPVLNSLTANYRSMPLRNIGRTSMEGQNNGDWFFGNEFTNAGKPFAFDQVGFRVNASINLFILDVTAYFDSYTIAAGNQITAFGAETAVDLFAGFAVRGFYRTAEVDGVQVWNLDAAGGYHRDVNYATELGVGIRHNAAAENALIPGLGLNLEYALIGPNFAAQRLTAEADYALNIAGISLDPYVSFVAITNDARGHDDTTIRAGTGLTTPALDIFLRPSLQANVNFRQSQRTNHPDDVANFTATELQYSVGVTLNEFLWDQSVFTARFGSYTGTNISVARRADPAADNVNQLTSPNVATRAHAPADNNLVQSTMGFELTWNYFDLQFAYGAYRHTIATTGGASVEETDGSRFRIRYVINF